MTLFGGRECAFVEGGWYDQHELPEALQGCWFDIETAPKDGTRILAAQGTWVGTCFWFVGVPELDVSSQGWLQVKDGYEMRPTHWMPLPALPEV